MNKVNTDDELCDNVDISLQFSLPVLVASVDLSGVVPSRFRSSPPVIYNPPMGKNAMAHDPTTDP